MRTRDEAARDPWWLRRPSGRAALAATGISVVLASAGAWIAASSSPLAARDLLPSIPGAREVFLSTVPDDPQRVLLVTQRSQATTRRGEAQAPGGQYWIHRYIDPARPGLPERILLTSRNRGARLLVPVGALDLATALATAPAPEPVPPGGAGAPPGGAGAPPRIRRALVQLYVDRLFAGAYLELRFPQRAKDAKGNPLRFDLVAVRGNRVRSVDFVLTPNPRYYRAALLEGALPEGAFVGNELPPGRELLLALYQDPARAPDPLQAPISLFDELGLAWGDAVPTLVDDRWQIEALPRYATAPASRERREAAARLVAVDLAARLEAPSERERLAHGLGEWLER
jgi:hypothetical protein